MKGFVEGYRQSNFNAQSFKFKDKAEYEDGRTTDLTGREAYQIYALVAKLVEAATRKDFIWRRSKQVDVRRS